MKTWLLSVATVASIVLPRAGAAMPCATEAHLAQARANRRVLPIVHLGGATKLTRDAFGTFPNEQTSTNFILKWGPGLTVSSAVIAGTLNAYEEAWAREITEMGHTRPGGTDTYKFNVYIGNSGGSAPEIPAYAAGYVTIDGEGYSYAVMHPDTLSEYDAGAGEGPDVTAAHEFFHAVQFATGAYDTSVNPDGYWYWEATADWAAVETFPEHGSGHAFVGAYALLPHVGLESVDYPDEGKLIEYHHYGAGIFAEFISGTAADWSVIRDSWVNAAPGDDPLANLATLLDARGLDFDTVYADFTAHNATWDYPFGATVEVYGNYFAQAFPDEDHRITADVGAKGTEGFVDAPAETAPEPLGYNVLRMEEPARGAYSVAIEGAAKGSKGTDSRLRATLVRESGADLEYIPLTDGAAEITVKGDEAALYLVVSAQPATRKMGESFAYRYKIERASSGGGGDGGFACSVSPAATTGSGASTGLLLLIAPLAFILYDLLLGVWGCKK